MKKLPFYVGIGSAGDGWALGVGAFGASAGYIDVKRCQYSSIAHAGMARFHDSVITGSCYVAGSVSGSKAVFNNHCTFVGFVDLEDSQFKSGLTIASTRVSLRNCKTKNIIIDDHRAVVGTKDLYLYDGTVIDGDIIFEGGDGHVYLYGSAKVNGAIRGALVINKDGHAHSNDQSYHSRHDSKHESDNADCEMPENDCLSDEAGSYTYRQSSSASRNAPFYISAFSWLGRFRENEESAQISAEAHEVQAANTHTDSESMLLESDNADNVTLSFVPTSDNHTEPSTESAGQLPGIHIPGWKGMPSRNLTNDMNSQPTLDGNLILARLCIGLWQKYSKSEEASSGNQYISEKEFKERRKKLMQRWKAIARYLRNQERLDANDQEIKSVFREIRNDFRNRLPGGEFQPVTDEMLSEFEYDTLCLEDSIPLDKACLQRDYFNEITKYRDMLIELTRILPQKPYPSQTIDVIENTLEKLKVDEMYRYSRLSAEELLLSYQKLVGWVQERHPARWKNLDSDITDFSHYSVSFAEENLKNSTKGLLTFLKSEVHQPLLLQPTIDGLRSSDSDVLPRLG